MTMKKFFFLFSIACATMFATSLSSCKEDEEPVADVKYNVENMQEVEGAWSESHDTFGYVTTTYEFNGNRWKCEEYNQRSDSRSSVYGTYKLYAGFFILAYDASFDLPDNPIVVKWTDASRKELLIGKYVFKRVSNGPKH